MDERPRKLVIIAVIAAFVVGSVLLIMRGDRSRDLVLKIEPVDPTDEVTVFVGGAVQEPGLYSLPRGSRLSDAIDLAGMTDTADPTSLNLAARLQDGQTYFVPEQSTAAAGSSDATGSSSFPDSSHGNQQININQASADSLQTLPGIGPALSERIIEYRNQHGPFSSLDQLSDVSGISDRMVEELRELATVAP